MDEPLNVYQISYSWKIGGPKFTPMFSLGSGGGSSTSTKDSRVQGEEFAVGKDDDAARAYFSDIIIPRMKETFPKEVPAEDIQLDSIRQVQVGGYELIARPLEERLEFSDSTPDFSLDP